MSSTSSYAPVPLTSRAAPHHAFRYSGWKFLQYSGPYSCPSSPTCAPIPTKTRRSSSACASVALASALALVPAYQATTISGGRAVVATVSVLARADYDNGSAALDGPSRCRRGAGGVEASGL